MYGAIIGDLAGSVYEYGQLKKIKPIYVNDLISKDSFYSDDTILTIAVLDAILNKGDYNTYLRSYIKKYADYKPNYSPYFKTSFSPNMIKWCNSTIHGTSIGNGAMMRISPIGYLFDTEEEVVKNAELATIPSHDSQEAIESATIIALMIYYFRKNMTKQEVYDKLKIKLEYKPFKTFNTTCYQTIKNCLYVLYNSTDFEDAIRKTILMGGDTDTNACIVGSIAESLYGIPQEFKSKVDEKIPQEFTKILRRGYSKIKI